MPRNTAIFCPIDRVVNTANSGYIKSVDVTVNSPYSFGIKERRPTMPTLIFIAIWPIAGLFGRKRWLDDCRFEFDSF
jgi:hypothetical protein